MNVNAFVVADSLEQAHQLLVSDRKNKIIGGGAWLKLSVKEVNQLISLESLDLDTIDVNNDWIKIGAMTTLREIEKNQDIQRCCSGILSQAVSKIMGVTVRNIATIGGSVMGRFSFSDLMAALLVMDARLDFYKQGEVPLKAFLEDRSFKNDILKSVILPKNYGQGYYKKVAATALDFSIINMSISYHGDLKIAVGSRPGMAVLATKTMDFLNQQDHMTDQVLEAAADIAINELNLNKNIRASKSYRETLVKTYLKRGIRQVIS